MTAVVVGLGDEGFTNSHWMLHQGVRMSANDEIKILELFCQYQFCFMSNVREQNQNIGFGPEHGHEFGKSIGGI